MSGSVASPTSAWVDETGIHAPTFLDILTYLQTQYRAIYGQDVYLENDSQDGQLLAVFASAINDANAMCFAAYNARGPDTAQGVGLSSVVKINGIQRELPTLGEVDLIIVGQAGTVILDGAASDELRPPNVWTLPAHVQIPHSGQVIVTAVAAAPGEAMSPADTITRIATLTPGWQTVRNPNDAVPGAPLEADGQLRLRQRQSTARPSQSLLDGVKGGIAEIDGVLVYEVYENDTNLTDARGLPPHSIAAVVEGGDNTEIARTILWRKTIGCYTHGTTHIWVEDIYGIPREIRFYRPNLINIHAVVTIHALTGYVSTTATAIKDAVADFINALTIGEDLIRSKLYSPINASDPGDTFDLTDVAIGVGVGPPPGHSNIAVGFYSRAVCAQADVVVTLI